jgi:hypothetical protein
MRGIGALACLVGLLIATSFPVSEGQELPTVLACTSNAKASRDYGFSEKRWSGQSGQAPSRVFSISGPSSKTMWGQFELRDKVFSGLNTKQPTVRSITRYDEGPEQAAEFVGYVVSRTDDGVFLVWTNEINKVWLAAVDLTHRKATVTQVFQGFTSIGGEMETLDCR